MPRKYAESYIDKLLSGNEYGDLVEISTSLCGSPQFKRTSADYSLPIPAFIFVETLTWFAQAIRSGVWTYYEATPVQRQMEMQGALELYAPEDFAAWFAQGFSDWEDEKKIHPVDDWIETNDDRANEWLRAHANRHRELFLRLTA